MISKIQNETEAPTILYSKPNGNVDFIMVRLDTLGIQKALSKGNEDNKKKLDSLNASRDLVKKDH